MQKTLFIKLTVIGALCLLLIMGLTFIDSLVYERQSYANEVIDEISKQHVHAQEVVAPFIVLPATVIPPCAENKKCDKPYQINMPLLSLQTGAQGNIQVSQDTFQRGVYHATSYQGQIQFKQRYEVNTTLKNLPSGATFTPIESVLNQIAAQPQHLQQANSKHSKLNSVQTDTTKNTFVNSIGAKSISKNDKPSAGSLIIPVSDLRGVQQLPTVIINGQKLAAKYPTTASLLGLNYVEVALDSSVLAQNKLNIDISMPLAGLSALRIVPLGQNFTMAINSNWHAPNFVGQALPIQKHFTNNGFKADWANQYLTVANNQLINTCLSFANIRCDIDMMRDNKLHNIMAPINNKIRTDNSSKESFERLQFNGFGVDFAKPNDVYLQTERTIKYALLLILVSFGTFFLFEVIKNARIHPIQYLLVGAALLIFYVLLLSLAEQVKFWQAYAVSASACVGLIGWYASYVLGSIKRGVIFAGVLGLLYAGFYGILTTEDMNLLLGALFCFALLASVMYLTRKIDWYQVA